MLTKRQEILTKRQEMLTKHQEILTKRQAILTKRQEILTKRQEMLTKPQEILTKRQVIFKKRQEILTNVKKSFLKTLDKRPYYFGHIRFCRQAMKKMRAEKNLNPTVLSQLLQNYFSRAKNQIST